MRAHILALLASMLFIFVPLAARAADVRAIDTRASHASFTVTHVLVQRVSGTLPILSGSLTFDADGALSGASAVLDPKHIDTKDQDRDVDLQSGDWFDAARFPRWTFKSTSVESAPGGASKIAGLLTIHGQSVPVVLAVQSSGSGASRAYIATTHVDRHAFGMARTTYDALVGADIAIELRVVAR